MPFEGDTEPQEMSPPRTAGHRAPGRHRRAARRRRGQGQHDRARRQGEDRGRRRRLAPAHHAQERRRAGRLPRREDLPSGPRRDEADGRRHGRRDPKQDRRLPRRRRPDAAALLRGGGVRRAADAGPWSSRRSRSTCRSTIRASRCRRSREDRASAAGRPMKRGRTAPALVVALAAALPAAAQSKLKVYISADMEGIAGVVSGEQLGPRASSTSGSAGS